MAELSYGRDGNPIKKPHIKKKAFIMPDKIWEQYWGGDGNHDYWKVPSPEVLDFIDSLSPDAQNKVLDLGCGLGRHAIAFALAGFSVAATDITKEAVDHLVKWADDLNLSIETKVCDMLDEGLKPESFDVVLSYNVIYHQSRELFGKAIQVVHRLLKPKGIFFFTCPSRSDGKYGVGKLVAPHTWESSKSVIPGDVHYFPDESDFDEFMTGYNITRLWKIEGYWENRGEQQFFSTWHVMAEKV